MKQLDPKMRAVIYFKEDVVLDSAGNPRGSDHLA